MDFGEGFAQRSATSTMLLTSVQVSLHTWLSRSTPFFIVEERFNNNNNNVYNIVFHIIKERTHNFIQCLCSESDIFLLYLHSIESLKRRIKRV